MDKYNINNMILIVRRLITIRVLFLMAMAKNSEILKRFGKRVRELRIQKGFTSQMDFALKTKLDRTYIGGIERGERNVSLENIQKISRTLDIKLEELFKF